MSEQPVRERRIFLELSVSLCYLYFLKEEGEYERESEVKKATETDRQRTKYQPSRLRGREGMQNPKKKKKNCNGLIHV